MERVLCLYAAATNNLLLTQSLSVRFGPKGCGS